MKSRSSIAALIVLALAASACGSDGGQDAAATATPESTNQTEATNDIATDTTDTNNTGTNNTGTNNTTGDTAPGSSTAASVAPSKITMVTYDSFPEDGTSMNDALAAFTEASGIEVELLLAGDTGTMLAKATLTAGNPEGDVMWGVDNTFLSRAIADGVFEPNPDASTGSLPAKFVALAPNGEAQPVDFGDVCVNYDIAYFADNNLDIPTSMQDLANPEYKDLLVVENPATSSPGLAFVLASIDEFGVDGWQAYWASLRDNGVLVADGWTDAYYGSFSWAGGGDRPLVVSYGSSPPAEVIFADPPRDNAPTGVIESTCFRQVEFVGVLAGTDARAESRALIDFLISDAFQSELALNLFVYPANMTTELPQEFIDFAVVPAISRTLAPALIDANRADWIDEWTSIVLD